MLDERMQAVINFVESGSKVADIGADHGYLSIELAKSSRAIKVIATEKNEKPCEAARKNISEAGLTDVVDVRLGDGLKVLAPKEVDTICIAGMGGALILTILDESPTVVKSAQRLILQPMNASEKVREWLTANDWTIDDEDLAESSGIIYEIISACKSKDVTQKIFKRKTSPLLKKFLQQRIEKFKRILNEMKKSKAAQSGEKFLELKKKIEALEEKF
ncbi:MAG: class I SAM-dependent methyltransferase [Selenomonadaceae bacterium]|nr:class I SAM-dependent methyltransferase [Selenomonadaceae bacterium]